MGYSSLARVLTGWTGAVSVTSGSTQTVTPFTRESVASLIARLVEAAALLGLTLSVSVSSAGVLTVSGNASFDLAFTSNTATRTGFTGSYTGATTYTAAGAFANGWVPAYGLRLADPLIATQGSAVIAGGAGVSGRRESASSQIVAWGSTIAMPDLSYEYDAWHDGRVFGRFGIRDARYVPLGRQRAVDQVRVELDVFEVT